MSSTTAPDGSKRLRRQFNPVTKIRDTSRAVWYATYRSIRFVRRFGLNQ